MLDTLMQSGSNQVSGAMLDTLFVCALYKTRKPREDREVIFAFAFLERMLLYTAVSSLANIGLPALSLVMTTHKPTQASTATRTAMAIPAMTPAGISSSASDTGQPRTPRLLPTAKSQMFLASSVARPPLDLGR